MTVSCTVSAQRIAFERVFILTGSLSLNRHIRTRQERTREPHDRVARGRWIVLTWCRAAYPVDTPTWRALAARGYMTRSDPEVRHMCGTSALSRRQSPYPRRAEYAYAHVSYVYVARDVV